MKIVDLTKADDGLFRQCAELLVEGFRVTAPNAWATLEDALTEVAECLAPAYLCRVAVDEMGMVLGWIGGRPAYDGNVG